MRLYGRCELANKKRWIRHLTILGLVIIVTAYTYATPAQETGEFIEIGLPGGGSFRAYRGGPADADAAIMIVHDWFGITEFTRRSVDRLGNLGYRVIAVDLYGGESATDDPTAQRLMNELDGEMTRSILRAGLQHLYRDGRRIAVVGFSMGGNIAVNATLLEPDLVAATAVIYGGGIENHSVEDLRTLGGPLLAITGSDDAWALNSTLAIRPLMMEAGRPFEFYVYPQARHAFAQPLFQGGANFDPTATRVLWLLLEDFLDRNLS